MRTDTADAWAALEAETGGGAEVTRRLAPASGHDLHAVLDLADRSRRLRYERTWEGEPPVGLPQSKAVRTTSSPCGAGRIRIEVSLVDARFAEPFTSLASDVATAAAAGAGDDGATAALLGRLEHWQELLARLREDGLSPLERRGLYGELHALAEHVLLNTNAAAAVEGWTGPSAANQDFQFPHCAIEVKTTSGKQPQALVVANERELDDRATGLLLMLHLSLDERRGGTGESLNDAAARVRQLLTPTPAALAEFEDRLARAGLLGHQGHLYDEPRYSVREQTCHRVGPGFPRITETDLQPGVGDVRYRITLQACQPHVTDIATLHDAVAGRTGDAGAGERT